MKKFLKQYAPHIGASAIAITAVATAAVTPLPGSLPASVTTGGTILAADINAMIDSLNILDERTDGDAPVDDVDIVNKGYLDSAVSAAGDWQKGVICPDGEIFQGYNADESAKCETPDDLGIASKTDIAGISGGGGSGTFDFSSAVSDGSGKYFTEAGNHGVFCSELNISSSGLYTQVNINESQVCNLDDTSRCISGKCETLVSGVNTQYTHISNYVSISANGNQIAAYCDALVEAGFDDWTIPTASVTTFGPPNNTDFEDVFYMDLVSEDGTTWADDPSPSYSTNEVYANSSTFSGNNVVYIVSDDSIMKSHSPNGGTFRCVR